MANVSMVPISRADRAFLKLGMAAIAIPVAALSNSAVYLGLFLLEETIEQRAAAKEVSKVEQACHDIYVAPLAGGTTTR